MIFHDTVLRDIAAVRPASIEELGQIKGVGASKLQRYGAAVLGILGLVSMARKAGQPLLLGDPVIDRRADLGRRGFSGAEAPQRCGKRLADSRPHGGRYGMECHGAEYRASPGGWLTLWRKCDP